jgi:hypothetical protein
MRRDESPVEAHSCQCKYRSHHYRSPRLCPSHLIWNSAHSVTHVVYPRENNTNTAMPAAVASGSCTAWKYTDTFGETPSIEHITPSRENRDSRKVTLEAAFKSIGRYVMYQLNSLTLDGLPVRLQSICFSPSVLFFALVTSSR